MTTWDFHRLHHVQLAIPPGGEDRCRAFWRDLLGLEELEKPPVLAARGGCWFRGGGLEVHLGVEEDFRPARKAHPGILVSGLRDLAARFADAGHPVTWDDTFPGHDRFYVADPFGNRLELLEAAAPTRPYRGVSADARRTLRRERIVAATLELVRERGVDAVTAESVSEAAGLTKRYFYESFADRDALLVSLLDDLLGAVRDAIGRGLATVADGSARDRIVVTVEALVDTLAADPARARLYAESPLRQALHDRRRAAQVEFADLVLTEVLRGGPDRRLDALFVVSGATDVVTHWLLGDLDLDRRALVDRVAAIGIGLL